MTWYQVWKDENGHEYIPSCEACGESMRSSPPYDGPGPFCRRKRCLKARVKAPCVCAGPDYDPDVPCPVPGHEKTFSQKRSQTG